MTATTHLDAPDEVLHEALYRLPGEAVERIDRAAIVLDYLAERLSRRRIDALDGADLAATRHERHPLRTAATHQDRGTVRTARNSTSEVNRSQHLDVISFGESAVSDDGAGDAGEGDKMPGFSLWRRCGRRHHGQAGLSRLPSRRTSGHGHTHAEEAQSVQSDGKVQNYPQAMKANTMQPRKTTVMVGSRTYQSFVGAQHTQLH
ncbi:hypothetical protein [Streptomyces sp. NPDC015242]|uniref:hypothetical protein n=1 Tax=Streptomyces sp. NPDC015242 TaxID=3364951 RepID=UPI0036F94A4C